jgi:hypothetical protein
MLTTSTESANEMDGWRSTWQMCLLVQNVKVFLYQFCGWKDRKTWNHVQAMTVNDASHVCIYWLGTELSNDTNGHRY